MYLLSSVSSCKYVRGCRVDCCRVYEHARCTTRCMLSVCAQTRCLLFPVYSLFLGCFYPQVLAFYFVDVHAYNRHTVVPAAILLPDDNKLGVNTVVCALHLPARCCFWSCLSNYCLVKIFLCYVYKLVSVVLPGVEYV